jgi:hypothetical protein
MLNDLERNQPVSLRQALEQLQAIGGRVVVEKGRVLVEAPPAELGDHGFGPLPGARLSAFFYRFEPAVLEAVGKDGEVKSLPGRPLLPSGRVAP